MFEKTAHTEFQSVSQTGGGWLAVIQTVTRGPKNLTGRKIVLDLDYKTLLALEAHIAEAKRLRAKDAARVEDINRRNQGNDQGNPNCSTSNPDGRVYHCSDLDCPVHGPRNQVIAKGQPK